MSFTVMVLLLFWAARLSAGGFASDMLSAEKAGDEVAGFVSRFSCTPGEGIGWAIRYL
ncbi:hypothetical protein [Geomonas limicola]|uniref:hypothetical protein n=1 Tax=Geomonas limicola TaxID=2740186 RepID=UPI00160A4F86|nr:hypothetical protein [Geomonas limicola]